MSAAVAAKAASIDAAQARPLTWFAVALAAELLSFTCNFTLQKLALSPGFPPRRAARLARRFPIGAQLSPEPAPDRRRTKGWVPR